MKYMFATVLILTMFLNIELQKMRYESYFLIESNSIKCRHSKAQF